MKNRLHVRAWNVAVAGAILTLGAVGFAGLSLPGDASGFLRHITSGETTLRGVVTYIDPNSDLLILQNAHSGYRLHSANLPPSITPGGQIEVTAGRDQDDREGELRATHLLSLPGYTSLAALTLTPDQLRDPRFANRLVEISGVVRSTYFEAFGNVGMHLRVGDNDVRLQVLDMTGIDADNLVDASLRVMGVLSLERDEEGENARPTLLTPSAAYVTVLSTARPLRSIPVRTVRALTAQLPAIPPGRVCLEGEVIATPNGKLRLLDQSGSILLESLEDPIPNRRYKVWGFAVQSREGLLLQNVTALPSDGVVSSEVQRGLLPELTKVSQVHSLSSTEARLGYPVTLHGVITFFYSSQDGLFFQDSTGGIFVSLPPGSHERLVPGQFAELKGITQPGGFAPVITKPVFTLQGYAPSPEPSQASLTEIFSGHQDSNWVELEGIVHSVGVEHESAYASLEFAGRPFRIYLGTPERLPDSLVDATVRVRGVCATNFNSRRELLGIQVFSQNFSFLSILKPQTPVAQVPLQSVVSLERFSAMEEAGHRHRIQGIATWAGQRGTIYLRDNTSAIRIESLDTVTHIVPGDTVEAVGFPRRDFIGSLLGEAEIRVLHGSSPPRPLKATAQQVVEDGLQSQLIQLTATLMDRVESQGGSTLVMRAGHVLFQAKMEHGVLVPTAKGSLLQLSGICELGDGSRRTARDGSFTLLLRSSKDVVVLRSAPWWSSRGFLWIMAGVGGLCCLVVIWAFLLRRQVRIQTEVIREQLSEAQRLKLDAEAASRAKGDFLANMSHEIRTPLNGVLGMTELALMEPVSDTVRDYLETAQASGLGLLQVINDVLDVSKIEAGQMTIEVAPLDLRRILQEALTLFRPSANQKGIRMHLVYPEHMPDQFEGDAVRIRQIALNLIGNALKFTEAGEVSVRVQRKAGQTAVQTVRISICDTGIGIPADKQDRLFGSFSQADTSTTRKYGGTGLGLCISKQLVELMNGHISFTSEYGRGSEFSFELPLPLSPVHQSLEMEASLAGRS